MAGTRRPGNPRGPGRRCWKHFLPVSKHQALPWVVDPFPQGREGGGQYQGCLLPASCELSLEAFGRKGTSFKCRDCSLHFTPISALLDCKLLAAGRRTHPCFFPVPVTGQHNTPVRGMRCGVIVWRCCEMHGTAFRLRGLKVLVLLTNLCQRIFWETE